MFFNISLLFFCAYRSTFDSLTGCQAAKLSEYTLYLDNFCFDVLDPSYGDYSYKFVFPNAYEYSKVGCKGHPQTVAMPTACMDTADTRRLQDSADGVGSSANAGSSPVRRLLELEEGRRLQGTDDGTTSLYEIWSAVHSHVTTTVAPTPRPTPAPSVPLTAGPTLKDQPTEIPSVRPTEAPTVIVTDRPSGAPLISPSAVPSMYLTAVPSIAQTLPRPVDQIVVISVQQVIYLTILQLL